MLALFYAIYRYTRQENKCFEPLQFYHSASQL